MKKWLVRIAIVTLILSLFFGTVWLISYFTDTPFLNVAAYALGVVALVALVVLGVRVVLRRRRDAAQRRAASPKETLRVDRLNSTWKSAIRRINQSKLKEKGNPIYVLPWYVILGRPESGKTRAVKNSRVAIPLDETNKPDGAGEQAPGWWLLDESILIDTPGRFTNQKESADTVEWRHFISLFNKYRKWQPVNGVIVTLPVDMLVVEPESAVRSYASELRSRLSELVQVFGVRFPVYVMITKSDLLGGMARFFEPFPENITLQAMGSLLDERSMKLSATEKVDRVFKQLATHLREMRLAILANAKNEEVLAPALVFPEELANLKSGVEQFVDLLLDSNYYSEVPQLRGVYFSSARQEGMPVSAILSAEASTELQAVQRKGERSYFLKGFMGKVLKADRNLVTPTDRSVYIQNIRQNLGVSLWVATCTIAGVLLTVSFFHNLNSIGASKESLPAEVALRNDIDRDIAMVTQFRQSIEELKAQNDETWIPSMGLWQSRSTEEELALIYAKRLREAVLVPFDQMFDQVIARVSERTRPEQVANLVDFLTKRIALHKLAIDTDQDYVQLSGAVAPNFEIVLSLVSATENEKSEPELQKDFLAYLAWTDNDKVLLEDRNNDERRLTQVLSVPGIGLEWLADWANLQPELQSVDTKHFWQREPITGAQIKKVRPAYTAAGWQAIQSFLVAIENGVQNKKALEQKKGVFLASYAQSYYNEWSEFLNDFHKGGDSALTGKDGVQTAQFIAGVDSPYELLLKRVVQEISPVVDSLPENADVPGWVPLVYSYGELSDPENREARKDSKGIGKIANKSAKVLGKFKGVLKGAKNLGSDTGAEKSSEYFETYLASLKATADQAQSPKASFIFAKEAYDEAGAVVGEPKNAINKVMWAKDQMRSTLGEGVASESVFWQVLTQRGEQVWKVVLGQAAISIDEAWQNDVLTAADGLSGWPRIEALQGPSGSIWTFHDKAIGSFVKKGRGQGYQSRELYHGAIAFLPSLLSVLDRGKVSQNAIAGDYKVIVGGLPTDVNREASVKPHLTKLLVSCGSGNIELLNYNNPIRKTITWSPQDCGDVVLEIHVGDAVLEKRYTGFNGFVGFLRDFRSGSRVFSREDFPEKRASLAGYRISNVTVGFQFRGQDSVLQLALKDPSSVPDRIIEAGKIQYAADN